MHSRVDIPSHFRVDVVAGVLGRLYLGLYFWRPKGRSDCAICVQQYIEHVLWLSRARGKRGNLNILGCRFMMR